jgi:hypothetical protein
MMTKVIVTTIIAAAGFVLFAPTANQHPECSISGFSPDLTQKQRSFCRDWNKR